MMDVIGGKNWTVKDCLADSIKDKPEAPRYTFGDVKINADGSFAPADQSLTIRFAFGARCRLDYILEIIENPQYHEALASEDQ